MKDSVKKQIWVDADACPNAIKETISKAAHRTQTPTLFVANHFLKMIPSPYIQFKQVPQGFDVADNQIIQEMSPGDLVVTQDIPLAALVIEKKGIALNPRGMLYTESNIKPRLNMRDFMETLRESGMATSHTPPLSAKEKQKFASELDKWLQKNNR